MKSTQAQRSQGCFLRHFTHIFCFMKMLFINDGLEDYNSVKHPSQLFVKVLLLYMYIYISKNKSKKYDREIQTMTVRLFGPDAD